jgi:drug/metabolite transporter (DMT)-like permease
MNTGNTSFFSAILFAGIAAFGNALYAFGQKKATVHENPFLFGALALFVGAVLLFIVSLYFKLAGSFIYISQNLKWIFAAAAGYVFLNIGLFFLYKNFGATYYTLYAVLAIISTSLLLAVIILKEPFNGYHIAALCTGGITVILFMLGKNNGY